MITKIIVAGHSKAVIRNSITVYLSSLDCFTP
jgi:hypothetical protein